MLLFFFKEANFKNDLILEKNYRKEIDKMNVNVEINC